MKAQTRHKTNIRIVTIDEMAMIVMASGVAIPAFSKVKYAAAMMILGTGANAAADHGLFVSGGVWQIMFSCR